MAHRSYRRRRTPIKNTKTYKKGMMQAAMVTFVVVGLFVNNRLISQPINWLQGLKSGVQS